MHNLEQFQIFYNQRHSMVCLVDEVDGQDYIAFSGGTMISIFEITEEGLVLFDEFNTKFSNSFQAGCLAIDHIKETNEELHG